MMTTTEQQWPAGYDRNDIEHVLGKHVKLPRRDCGHCAWFYAPAPIVTRQQTRSKLADR